MTDVKRLERAARAANLPWDQWVTDGDDSWNPIEDSGQALGLAVILRIDVLIGDDHVRCVLDDGAYVDELFADHEGQDPEAATRLAIVRAAGGEGYIDPRRGGGR
jgi:hypothetical protein